MPANRLPHPLLAARIDFVPGDGDAIGRRGDCGGDHCANRGREAGDIGLRHDRQSSLEGHHVVTKQMSERRVQGRPKSPIEQRRDIPERVACHKELDPVDMRPLVQKFLP